jgi:nucleoid-associated protein YgaU
LFGDLGTSKKGGNIVGIFNFVANAGKRLLGGGKAAKPEESAAAIKKEISDLELGDVDVTVQDNKVILNGRAASQADLEKIVLAAGNIDGIETVEAEIETDDDAPEATFHTVERGDSLSAIAKKVYGDAMKYPVIFEANKPMLSHPDKIYPGQVLRIPALED